VLQSDGKIIVAGGGASQFGLVRLHANGTVDNTFGTDGKVRTSGTTAANAIALQSDGKIVVAGSVQSRFGVVRYERDGSLDLTFNSTGMVNTTFPGASEATGIRVQPDGGIVVAGYTYSNGDIAVARYNPDGSPDLSFNGTGKVLTAIGGGDDQASDVIVQNDGKIVVVGHGTLINPDFAVVRYLSNGSLDTSFNNSGKLTFGVSTFDYGRCIGMQANGQIVVAGYAGSSSTTNNFVTARLSASLDPEIVIEEPVGQALPDNGAINFGNIEIGAGSTKTFTIRNCGDQPLTGITLSKDGPYSDAFSLGLLGVATLAPGASTTFTVTFNAVADGEHAAALHISSNDPEESLFDISIAGNGVAPEIAVEQPSLTDLVGGSASVTFGAVSLSSTATLTFTVRNRGTGPLNGLAISKSGPHAQDFSVTELGATTIAVNSSRTFSATFDPSEAGLRTATLHIASNDPDENPFDIALSGIGTAPDIVVEQPPGRALTDNTGIIDFGILRPGQSVSITFGIRNDGSSTLSSLAYSISGTHAADFVVNAFGGTSLTAGSSRSFTVVFTPAAVGDRTATMRIVSNDPDENPYEINFSGVASLLPEISVEQPAGVALLDGATSPVNFGSIPAGSGSMRTFTIRNEGTANLAGIVVTVSGGSATGDFSVWDLQSADLAVGGAATFSVFFSPGGPGPRTTTLLISSNDEDESSFEIPLIGTRADRELEVWRQTFFGSTANAGAGADTSDPDHDGIVNLMEFATGTGPWTANTPPGTLRKAGGLLEFAFTRRRNALSEVSYEVEWSDTLAGPWSSANVITQAANDENPLQEMKATVPAGTGKRFLRLRVTRQ